MPEDTTRPLYRVDQFVVPEPDRKEFLDRVAKTQALLKQQPGFLQDFVLERQSGPGAVAKLHTEMEFDRREMIARLGITADLATYEQLDM